jgi:hypothetical protein
MANENSNDLDLTLVSARTSAKRLGLVDLPQMHLRKQYGRLHAGLGQLWQVLKVDVTRLQESLLICTLERQCWH